MKKNFNKEIVMTKKDYKILKTLLNAGFVIIIMLTMMLKEEIIIKSLESLEAQHIETVISRLNQIIKLLSYTII